MTRIPVMGTAAVTLIEARSKVPSRPPTSISAHLTRHEFNIHQSYVVVAASVLGLPQLQAAVHPNQAHASLRSSSNWPRSGVLALGFGVHFLHGFGAQFLRGFGAPVLLTTGLRALFGGAAMAVEDRATWLCHSSPLGQDVCQRQAVAVPREGLHHK